MNVLVVLSDRIFAEDPAGWGLWEKDSETGELVMRLYGPEKHWASVVEYAHMLSGSIERLTGVQPTVIVPKE